MPFGWSVAVLSLADAALGASRRSQSASQDAFGTDAFANHSAPQ